MMTSTIGNRHRGFTLIEMAVVIAIIFILASSLIFIVPKVEAEAARKKAMGDIARLDLALDVHYQIRGWYPPDNIAHCGDPGTSSTADDYSSPTNTQPSPVPWLTKGSTSTDARPAPINTNGFTAEEISNILMVHFLTAARERDVFLEFSKGELKEVGLWRSNSAGNTAPGRSQLDPAYSALNVSRNFNPLAATGQTRRAFMFVDPWGNPYVYDNNVGLPTVPRMFLGYRESTNTSHGNQNGDPNRWFDGLPNNNPDFDLYSLGPNGRTALLSTGQGNGINDDGNPDFVTLNEPSPGLTNYLSPVWDDALYNGRERTLNGELGDDFNNFKAGQ